MRNAIATLEQGSQELHNGSTVNGWTFGPKSCKAFADSIDLMLDTHLMLLEIIRELGAAEADWVEQIGKHEAKIATMNHQVEQMRRVLELGILSKN
jgi:pentose-5-phosphate-3-epimerase